MRCLYCGKQLALFKKLTGGGEFCSDAHKQSYHEEYNKLALSRLMEAQTRQEDQTARPPGAIPVSAPEQPAFAEPTARGGYFKQTVAGRQPGSTGVTAPVVRGPADWPIELPASDKVWFFPELPQAGVMMEHRGVSSPAEVMAPAPNCVRASLDAACAFPEQRLEIDTTVIPGAAGPVEIDAGPVQPGEPELQCEPAAGFEFSWAMPETLDLDWVDGLEFARSEQRLETLMGGIPGESAAVEETKAAAVPEPAAEPEPEAELEELPAAVANPLVVSVLASATPEPVINEELLLSLFGSDDEPAPAATVPEAHEPAPVPAAAGPVPHEPGSFLPVVIRPAGPPNKTRLMQSFQAIALVNANPQIPVWNMLPLRPKMALGRGPGPGAGMVDRGKAEAGAAAEARKAGSAAVDVAHGPEPAADDEVPTFGAASKPRGGLSRWFKLSILAGVLGIAGGMFHPAEASGAGVAGVASNGVAGTRQDTATELAVCRN